MFRIAICQDHGTDATQIAADLKKLAEDQVLEVTVDLFRSIRGLKKAMSEHNYQLLLLGTTLADGDGIEFGRYLRETETQVDILYLAEDASHAVAAYSAFPVGYLIEPITRKALKDPFRYAVRKARKEPRLIFRGQDGTRISVGIGEIQYIEVFRTELDVHTKNGVSICTGSLSEVYSKLPAIQFYRSHRSYIVNLDHVSKIERYQFTMKNGDSVTVAKNRYAEAKRALQHFANEGAGGKDPALRTSSAAETDGNR